MYVYEYNFVISKNHVHWCSAKLGLALSPLVADVFMRQIC